MAITPCKYWPRSPRPCETEGSMKAYTRNASASWLGTHQHGKGAITAPVTLLRKMPYSAGSAPKRGATSPPELMAAAHAGSFAMSLANELQIAGFSPKQIDTTAAVTMEPRPAGWRITQIHLDVVATVARVLQADFVGVALRAKANCPISQVVSANISMRARLDRRGDARLMPHRESQPRLRAGKNIRRDGGRFANR
jgi:lipoyl-dependent peroxiredoxin